MGINYNNSVIVRFFTTKMNKKVLNKQINTLMKDKMLLIVERLLHQLKLVIISTNRLCHCRGCCQTP